MPGQTGRSDLELQEVLQQIVIEPAHGRLNAPAADKGAAGVLQILHPNPSFTYETQTGRTGPLGADSLDGERPLQIVGSDSTQHYLPKE